LGWRGAGARRRIAPVKLLDWLRALAGKGAGAGDARFRALTEACAAAVLIVQEDLVRYANPAAGASTGTRRDELVGRRFSELAHPGFREGLRLRTLELSRSGQPQRFELKLAGPGGKEAYLDLTLTAIQHAGKPALLAMGFDVTDRKLAEDAMRESERRMRDLIENVQLISVLVDTQGDVSFANEYVLELLGYEEEEVVGRNWFELALPEDRRARVQEAYLERIPAGAIAPHDEYEIVTAKGERRFVSWNNTVLHDPQGRVSGMASIGADVTERRRAEERLLHDALHDSLTGLPNRALFMDRLRGAVARLKRRPQYLFAVLFLDVDRFKVVNDSLGHVAGDQFLVQLSRLIAGTIRRPEHTLARLGGDEFAILLDDIEKRDDAPRVAERIFQALQAPIKVGSQEIFSSVSIGIAFSAIEYDGAEDVLRDADTAMYQAKTTGKARFQIFDDSMHTRALRLLKLEHSLRRAVDKGEFLLHFQPIVALADGAVAGLEALVRWEHPERGLISPSEFVHLAEETGLIYGIGRWTLREACRRLSDWDAAGQPGLSMNVNLSARQFSQPDLIELIESVLAETGLQPERLKLEITESVIMESPEVAVAMLHRLKELGTRLCIDDFGTGYSSLSYLLRFPADTLKIDRSFVAALGDGGKNEDIVGAIVSLGRSLEMDVVAEGVETEAQRDILRSLGCGFGQGYFFSRPVASEQVQALLV
jgi:diguanylate cyclase (GGDEF)-like protein/PAS domain S-box-containing protein